VDSKRPDEKLIFGLLDVDPRAIAIVKSWNKRLPVVVMPSAEFDELIQARKMCFEFPEPDEDESESYPSPDEWVQSEYAA